MRQQLEDRGMQVDDAPEDEDIRETFNFAPGNFGAVYRADIPDRGHGHQEAPNEGRHNEHEASEEEQLERHQDESQNIKYKIQSMKWGLIPFWTKRAPDYGSMMRTINCRDDSLIEDRGMWTTMKRRKRCIVICQGFYEWLKKGPGGKEKVPHFVKRKDGDLMCFAGLWDCVQYEGKILSILVFSQKERISLISNSSSRFRRETLHLHCHHNLVESLPFIPT
jgi:putative SOS response-associated peptidase YedK